MPTLSSINIVSPAIVFTWAYRKTGTLEKLENRDPSGSLEKPERWDPSGNLEKPENLDPSGTLKKLENQDPSGTLEKPEINYNSISFKICK